jgi:Glycosyltransferase family 87
MTLHPKENRLADPSASLRWSIYAILITISAGMMLGKIASLDSVDKTAVQNFRIKEALQQKRAKLEKQGLGGERLEEAIARESARIHERFHMQRPFLSANDRSRWCTIRVLVEPDLRVEGNPWAIDRVTVLPGWDTIDMVKHDGHLYSSKPALLPTLLAGEYWLIYQLTGWTLGENPYEICRVMLVTINVLPLILLMILIARLAERFGESDFARVFVVATAAMGTFLTTFSVTLNNHIVGAVCAGVALYTAVRIICDGRRHWRYFIIGGLATAFCAANELPALSLLAALGALLLWKSPKQTLLGFCPAVVLIGAAFFGTNYAAHGCLTPPYMHRTEGDNWYDFSYEKNGRTIDSYWRNPSGIDRGESSTSTYAFHASVGHHGVFSLTPVWIFSMIGMVVWIARFRDNPNLAWIALLIAAVSIACMGFFFFIESHGRNYGGMTCGFRWLFWLAPLWLFAMLPTVDMMARRCWSQALALVLLAASVFSVTYPLWNPWSHPWLSYFLYYATGNMNWPF